MFQRCQRGRSFVVVTLVIVTTAAAEAAHKRRCAGVQSASFLQEVAVLVGVYLAALNRAAP